VVCDVLRHFAPRVQSVLRYRDRARSRAHARAKGDHVKSRTGTRTHAQVHAHSNGDFFLCAPAKNLRCMNVSDRGAVCTLLQTRQPRKEMERRGSVLLRPSPGFPPFPPAEGRRRPQSPIPKGPGAVDEDCFDNFRPQKNPFVGENTPFQNKRKKNGGRTICLPNEKLGYLLVNAITIPDYEFSGLRISSSCSK
jgi:hypothetical protein